MCGFCPNHNCLSVCLFSSLLYSKFCRFEKACAHYGGMCKHMHRARMHHLWHGAALVRTSSGARPIINPCAHST